MKIIVHTPLGVFESKEVEYSVEGFTKMSQLVERSATSNSFMIQTLTGEICIPKGMIQQSVFVLEK